MAIPVRFYSVTSEEFEKILAKMEEEKKEKGSSPLEDGIFFVDGSENSISDDDH